uniref:Uncharacterized protein n=1 Tax=Oryza rufipogon TaxID=4529 RepID=A0A0E0PKS5_ORYRU
MQGDASGIGMLEKGVAVDEEGRAATAARLMSTEKGVEDDGEGRAATTVRSMATAVEWRMGRRSMGRRTWRRWRGEATQRRGLIASHRRRVEGRLHDATRWRRGRGGRAGGRGRRTATEGAHKPAWRRGRRRMRRGRRGRLRRREAADRGGDGEADSDGGALAGEKTARKGEGVEGAEKATALEGEETPGQATEAASEMDGDGGGDGGEWRWEN